MSVVDCRNRFRPVPSGSVGAGFTSVARDYAGCVDGRGDVELEQPWGERENISPCDCDRSQDRMQREG